MGTEHLLVGVLSGNQIVAVAGLEVRFCLIIR